MTTCRKCHRPLTDPTSVAIGMGPTCRGGTTLKRVRHDSRTADLFNSEGLNMATTFEPEGDLYVLIVERDSYKPCDDSRPIVFEQHLDQGAASLENIKAQRAKIGNTYGRSRIAKLVFLEDEKES